MSKIILFNAPKSTGKSEAIKYLRGRGFQLTSAECKNPLHDLTMTLFGISPERYWEIYNTRELKEVPLSEFTITFNTFEEQVDFCEVIGSILDLFGVTERFPMGLTKRLSIREAMIYVSEVVVKPRWGEDWFGKERVRKMDKVGGVYICLDTGKETPVLFCDDSCAFVDELTPLINYLGQENILLIRLHREGFTFEGDSRNYIPDGVITNTVDINNNSTEQEYLDEVEEVVKRFLDEKNTD